MNDNVELNKTIEEAGLTEEQVENLVKNEASSDTLSGPLNTPELNEAAANFMTNIPRIKALASNMSKKGLARVFKSVVEFPLAESYPRFQGAEQELFILTLNVLSAKNVMTSAFMAQSGEQITNDAVNGVVESLKEEMGV